MDCLENMKLRVRYNGGDPQQSRMIEDKLKSLKKAYLYSYQAGVIELQNPSEIASPLEFRCLMNPDKVTFDTNKMILSIPFRDSCLTLPNKDKVDVPIKCGTTFLWKQTNTRWIVTLQYLTELAYFRADVRKCYPFPIEINGKEYWFASIGENEQIIEWNRRRQQEWNKLNYTRTLYIERNKETFDYFKRFKIIKLPNIQGELESWEVQAVGPNSVDDILIVRLKEYFENQFDDLNQDIQIREQEQHELQEDLITYPFETIRLSVPKIDGADFNIINISDGLKFNIKTDINDNSAFFTIQLVTGNTGDFDVTYNDVLIKHVVVKSF